MVLSYIEIGYIWGARNGVEVVPVIPAEGGLFICRPVPGRGASAAVLAAAHAPEEEVAADGAAASDLRAVAADLRHTLSGLLTLMGGLGTTADGGGVAGADGEVGEALPEADAGLTRSVRIRPGPGDMLFCPAYWHDVPPELYRGYSAAGAKIVILVHDILPIIFPQFYNAPWCHDFRCNVVAAYGFADAFCTVSHYTRHGLAELGVRERLAAVPMMTSYNGFEPMVTNAELERLEGPRHLPESAALATMGDLGRYYLMVGSIEPKKGHRPVIHCFEAMWREGLASNLVIIGRPGWQEADAVAAIEESPFYQTKLFWFSGLDDFELGRMYEGARALVFSSLGEGFGIPMIEAAAYGRPVVAYDTPIVREILGERARMFTTAGELVARVVEMERDGPHAAAAADARVVAWPSWQTYTPRVFDALRDFFEGAADLPEMVPLYAAGDGA